MADAPEFDDNEPIAPLAQQSKPAAPEFDDNEPIEPLGGAPAPIAPALTAQQRYRQSLKGYHDQGTENPDVAPGYVSPETSKAFAEAKSNTSSLGSQWGDVGIGAAKGLAGGVSGGWLGDIESIGRLPFQIPGVRENIADVSPHTAIPTSEEGGYLGPRGLGAFNAPETPEEKGGAFIGSMLSPNVISGGAKAVGKGIKHIAGQATFVGPKALEIAYSAGKEGGEAAQAFRENITKSVDLADIIPEVKSSIDNMRAARNAGYVSDMKELGKNVTPLNFDEIDKAVARSTQVKTFKGQDLSPATTKIRQEMNDAIKEWRSLDPEVYHTPVGMDALKQKLGDFMENALPGTPERVVASDIYNAVRQTIIKEAPEYAPIMKAYENSSAQIKEIEKALSLGNNASADTGLRKLQSILRDNVNASYGSREQLAKYLIANGSPHLMEKLAGQALRPNTPRGLGKLAQNVGAHMAAIAAAASTGVVAPILTFMAGVAVSSPRLMGNLSYLSGVAARYGEKIPAKAAIRTGILADTVTPDGTQPRATGGSVFDKMQNGGVPLPTPSPRMENYNAANVEMDLTPEEQALYQRHLSNLYGTGGVDNQNGKRSTLYQSVQQGPDGKYYNVPTVWDGKIETENWTRPADGKVFDVPNAVAKQNIGNAGLASFPSYATSDEADTRYDQMHRYMEKDTNQYQKKKGGSVFDKMHMARKRAEGGGTDAPFNEWDAVPRNAEGIPQIRIEKPPVNEADEAQAAREAAAARVAGNVRGAPYEPTPPSTEGKTWMMEPGMEAMLSGNYEMPPNVRLNDANIPYNVETGEELQMARRPNVLPFTRTPDGVPWAMPKIAELAGYIGNPLAVTKGLALNPGEFALGSGPIKSDPKLWHGISKIKLPKPISEMNATRSPIAEIAEKQIVPSDLQGGLLLPAIGDRSIANANLHGFNGYKFEEPVPMQGGHGFMAANADKDVAWASGSPVIGRIASDVRKLNESGNPIYFPYTAMGERSVDFSHHISSTLAEALKQQPLTRNAERQFNAAMKSDAGSFGAVKNWPGVNSPYLKDYLLSSKGDVRNKFAKLMDTNNFQSLGFPNVAEARFAVTDPRLLNAPTGAAGISVSKLDPSGKILKDVSGHLTYDTDLGGKYVGGLGRSIPKEVFYPDLLSAYKKLNYEPFQYDYLMSRGVTGAPRAQKANQKWVDNVSKWIEKNPKEETKFNSGGSVFDKMKRASK